MKALLKKIYESIPGKLLVYNPIRKVFSIPKKWQAYFYFKGIFTTKIGHEQFKMMNYGYQFHVENELFWGGLKNGWEKESTRLWLLLCEKATSIMDVGANTGYYSLIAGASGKDKLIYAFEPMPRIYEKLTRNVEFNNFKVNCVELALSDYTGTAKIFPTSLDHVYSVTVNKNLFHDRPSTELEIKTKRLAEFIEEHQISQVDLMKIDVETHEVEVLTGMGDYLRQYRPDMLIEIQNETVANGVHALLADLNYDYYNIDEKKGVKLVSELHKSDTLNYLVCKRETSEKLREKILG